jgi:hypothetical protein
MDELLSKNRKGKKVLCMVEVKRNLAYTFVCLKHEILRDIVVVDPNSNTDLDALVELIGTQWKTINTVKYLKNEDMVPCLLLLMSIVRTLSPLLAEHQEQQQALVCATCNVQQPERTPMQEYYNSLLKLQSDLDNRIAEQAGAGTGTDSASKLFKGLTLLAAMVGAPLFQ